MKNNFVDAYNIDAHTILLKIRYPLFIIIEYQKKRRREMKELWLQQNSTSFFGVLKKKEECSLGGCLLFKHIRD